jgi:hypothetical protein
MMDVPDNLFAVVSVSTAEGTLGMCDRLIGIAKQLPDDAPTLAACALIVLTAALEQASRTVLSDALQMAEMTGEHPGLRPDRVRHLWKRLGHRIQELPAVLTEGRFRLNLRSPLARDLEKLIKLRNRLVHVEEEAQVVTGPSGQITVKHGPAVIHVPLPENPWITVNVQHIERFREAVDVYFLEVLFPDSGCIGAGALVVSTQDGPVDR